MTTDTNTQSAAARANWWESANVTIVRLERNLYIVGDVAAIADPKGKYGVEGRFEKGAEVAYRRDGRAELMGLLGL